ncbi:MAG: CBS domain-containing protein [Bacteroidota bacterium]
MKISASAFSNKTLPLSTLVQEIEACGIDYVHVDCNDDPNIGEAIATIRAHCNLPIDLHIISPNPERFYDVIQDQKVEMVTLQYEDLGGRKLDLPDLGCQWGLSIVTDTPVEVFQEYQDACDFILLMTTVPGQSGGRFDQANFRKIRDFRRLHSDKRIHVDGGVNAEISFVLRNMGVFCAVSGSFLVNAESISKAYLRLLVQRGENPIRVQDFMHELNELPVLSAENLRTGPLLRTIEDFKMGYCLLTDEHGNLAGLVSNADVRRGMLRHIEQLEELDAASMVNPTPKSIVMNATVSELLRFVKQLDFLVLYMPVVDEAGKLVGAVNFNHLIIGEL